MLTYTYMWIYIYTYMYEHMHIHACAHFTYTHTHTQSFRKHQRTDTVVQISCWNHDGIAFFNQLWWSMASWFPGLGPGKWRRKAVARRVAQQRAECIWFKLRIAMKTRRTFVNRKVLAQLPVLRRQQGNGETKRGGGERPSGNRHTQVNPGSDLCRIGPSGISA